MRCTMIQNAELPARAHATGTVTKPDGTVTAPPVPQTPGAGEAYRFIRMSRTSHDLFDSYRNMFLAFECLLCDIRPPRKITTRRGCGSSALGSRYNQVGERNAMV